MIMFKDIREARAFVESHGIKMVDFKFTDLNGRWHHVTIPVKLLDDALMRDGIGFDASSVGLRPVKAGDMVLLPDLTTAFVDPFWEMPTLSLIASAFEADTKTPFVRDPRNIARRAETVMRDLGIADDCLFGPEYEFYVFDNVAFENEVNSASYRVDSREADWQSAKGGHGHVIPRHGGYHVMPPKDQLYNLRSEMSLVLEDIGVPVKYHHHEVGGPGQCEIETPLMALTRAGDATQMVKYVTKMVAHRHQQTVTYMPKPLFGEAGNGMHFHQLLVKGGANVFYDADGYGKLGKVAFSYIAGLLLHAPALLAITNPSTNSYRRLIPGFEAPVNAFFSLGNRSAAIRVPKYADQPETARMEFRPPDGTCNVYLALAAQLMAGLDGIRRQLDPTALGYGPFDGNVFNMTEEQRKSIKPLPASLSEALDALERDHAFLLEGGVFDEGLIADLIKVRYDEHYAVRNRPHPYEVALYFDV
jgi:glutamine synthetase